MPEPPSIPPPDPPPADEPDGRSDSGNPDSGILELRVPGCGFGCRGSGCLIALGAYLLLGLLSFHYPPLTPWGFLAAAGWCFGTGVEALWRRQGRNAFGCAVGAVFLGAVGGVAAEPAGVPFALAAGIALSFFLAPPRR